VRLFSVTLAGLMAVAAIATMAGCTQPTSAPAASASMAQACAPANPWVPAGYGRDGKWVPGHCQGQAAQ
jgi:hypothetical protein